MISSKLRSLYFRALSEQSIFEASSSLMKDFFIDVNLVLFFISPEITRIDFNSDCRIMFCSTRSHLKHQPLTGDFHRKQKTENRKQKTENKHSYITEFPDHTTQIKWHRYSQRTIDISF